MSEREEYEKRKAARAVIHKEFQCCQPACQSCADGCTRGGLDPDPNDMADEIVRLRAALTRTAGVGYLDSVLVAIVCDVRGGMSTTAILDKYRAALAASTRTGEDTRPTTPTRGSDE